MKKKFMNFLEKLSRDEMRTIEGGYGGSGLSYCAESYMIRSCNNLGANAMAGWQTGWSTAGCNESGGTSYFNEVQAGGYSMAGCNTSWYSY